ncbi:hypothetical protein J437_LFUL008375 [Ladona fulva]|uniref:Uncharacterized protein n=1 Tax=Ladona fulva TaxID=123851 RepID=A0A8K0K503_LADFU|nr:hypothetical protein J437_LFUL008375 [Ladona fulva]
MAPMYFGSKSTLPRFSIKAYEQIDKSKSSLTEDKPEFMKNILDFFSVRSNHRSIVLKLMTVFSANVLLYSQVMLRFKKQERFQR